MARQHAADEFMEGSDLLDLGQREFLCPVCRRLGNTLVPALAPLPVPLPSPRLSSQGMEPSLVLPDQATQQQPGQPGGQAGTAIVHEAWVRVVTTAIMVVVAVVVSNAVDKKSSRHNNSVVMLGAVTGLVHFREYP